MNLDDSTRLHHMLDSAKEALSFLERMSRRDLDDDRKLVHALVRCIEIIGEAASQVSQEGRDKHLDLPWKAMVGMRNRLIHGYFDVDIDRVWDTVQDEFPPLIAKLEAILSDKS